MKYLLLALFLMSCGEDENEVIYQQPLPPPIPPITRHEAAPQQDSGPPQITVDQCLLDARLKYPWVTIREGYSQNAHTQFLGYRRVIITMGTHLRRTIDSEQWCAILNHELGHAVRNTRNEIIADYYSMIYLRQMLMRRRYIHHERRMDRIARKQHRWLRSKPRSHTHPHPDKRLRIMRKAIKRQKLTRSDYI